jgi:hypothetical protein
MPAGELNLEQAIQEFDAKAKSYLIEEVDKVGKPEHPELFHYCSLENAFNILKSGTIWATGIFHLNDATEVSYGAGIMAECLKSRTEIHPNVRGVFGSPEKFMRTADKWPMFVFCFSFGSDLLSQWRAYGKSGGGVCIGFDRARLPSILPKKGPDPTLFPVIYEKKAQEDLLNRVLDVASEFQSRLAPGSDTAAYWLHAVSLVAQSSFRLKHEAFSDEREWRLLWMPGKAIHYRPVARKLIPYIECEFCKAVITKVVQGPLFNPVSGEDSLRMFLEAKGYRHAGISRSSISLRAL